MRYRLAAIGLLGLATSSAYAVDCKDGGATQSDMTECAGDALKKSDAELNAKYGTIMACLASSSGDKASLVEAQRAWLRYRDAECKFKAGASAGGSVHPMVVAGCLDAMTQRRSAELDYYLTCQEGDLTCPTFNCPGRAAPKSGQAK